MSENHVFDDIRIEGSIAALINLNMTSDSRSSSRGYIRNVILRNITLGFKTFLDREHRVEFKNHLSEASWQTLAGQIPGTGREYQISDSINQSAGSRFCRVARLP
ncbi:MAG: hypothetical protein ABSH34_15220 [Verrucomicrobiota bacterium]|jgi:hypothetical protein